MTPSRKVNKPALSWIRTWILAEFERNDTFVSGPMIAEVTLPLSLQISRTVAFTELYSRSACTYRHEPISASAEIIR